MSTHSQDNLNTLSSVLGANASTPNFLLPNSHTSVNNVAKTIATGENTKTTETKKAFAQTTLAMAQLAKTYAYWDWGLSDTCPDNSTYITEPKWSKTIKLQGNLAHPYYPELCKIINPRNDTNNGLFLQQNQTNHFQVLYSGSIWTSNATLSTRVLRKHEYGQSLKAPGSMHFIQYLNPCAPANWKYVAPPQCYQLDSGKCKVQSIDNDNLKLFDRQRTRGVSKHLVVVSPPLSRSEYVKTHKWLFEPLHAAVANASATMIDLADNFSDGDKGLQANPDGHPIV
ncbi:hypothetical protein THRCLA_09917 [Thraustotheca clavata]|uniref:Uncharacterized protein n=1 Tax=Thraustotheca clavata TaxID=74557 RepID=A0A1V9YU41_9STRA|nr:hypothetical protein THRCLA_09917 [Thraustotheca clavata]